MAYQAPLRAKKPGVVSSIVLWLCAHGWQYTVTVNRGVILATVWEQIKYKWTVWRMSRALIARCRERHKEPQA